MDAKSQQYPLCDLYITQGSGPITCAPVCPHTTYVPAFPSEQHWKSQRTARSNTSSLIHDYQQDNSHASAANIYPQALSATGEACEYVPDDWNHVFNTTGWDNLSISSCQPMDDSLTTVSSDATASGNLHIPAEDGLHSGASSTIRAFAPARIQSFPIMNRPSSPDDVVPLRRARTTPSRPAQPDSDYYLDDRGRIVCKECHRAFTEKCNFRKHKRNIHGQQTGMFCINCGAFLSRADNLPKHQQTAKCKRGFRIM